MEVIRLSTTIDRPLHEVYEMLSSLGGLRSWLTRDTTGTPKKGGEVRLGFGSEHFSTFTVSDTKSNKSLTWILAASTLSNNKEGVGTRVFFKLSETRDRGTEVVILHDGWSEIGAFYRVCGYQWEKSLESLKKACETGSGDPLTPTMITSRKASGWFPIA